MANPFMSFARNNSDALLRASAGLLGGQTGPQQAMLGLGGFADARASAREKQMAMAQKNKTLEFLRNVNPNLAAAVEAGAIAPADAYKTHLQAQMPQKGTDDMREYDFAKQQGFEGSFMDFMTANRKAGATNVTTNIGGDDYNKQLHETVADQAMEQRAEAADAASLIGTVQTGRSLLDEGAITGAGANWRVGALKWANTLGIDVDLSAANNSQAFEAAMGQAVAKIIKQFGAGTGLSDADRQFARQIVGGDVRLDEQAIRRILDIGEKAARAKIEAWNSKIPNVISGDIPSMLQVPMPGDYTPPTAPSAPQGGTQSYKDYF